MKILASSATTGVTDEWNGGKISDEVDAGREGAKEMEYNNDDDKRDDEEDLIRVQTRYF